VIKLGYENIINNIVNSIDTIAGVDTVVLGGSRATGNNIDTSDIDIGIYYMDSKELDIQKLNLVAAILDDEHRQGLITNLLEWVHG
jgi:predicted nucleotidyltransferase